MFIETERTPNPATLKFLPGRAVMDAGTRDFATPEEAETAKRMGGLPENYESDVLQPFLDMLSLEVARALQAPLDEVFAAVDAPRTYNPEALRTALRKLRTAADQLR
mgnify:CR=1 FL=1